MAFPATAAPTHILVRAHQGFLHLLHQVRHAGQFTTLPQCGTFDKTKSLHSTALRVQRCHHLSDRSSAKTCLLLVATIGYVLVG